MLPSDFDLKRFAGYLWRELTEDHVGHGAAALAFYLALALFPGAIFVISTLRYVPIPRLERAVLDLVGQALPPSSTQVFSHSVETVSSQPHVGVLAFGLLFAVWSAASGVTGIMRQLNIVYEVEEDRSLVRVHLTALLLTFCCCGVMLSALALAVYGGMLQQALGERFGFSAALLKTFAALRWVVIALSVEFAFSLLYWLGPNVKRSFTFFTPGSLVATGGVFVGSFAVKLYAAHSVGFGMLYGNAGAMMILLIWLFLGGWATLVGGEINDALARCVGTRKQANGTRALQAS